MAHVTSGDGEEAFAQTDSPQQVDPNTDENGKQRTNCCAKFQAFPSYKYMHSNVNVLAALPISTICYLPGTPAQQATSAPVDQLQQQPHRNTVFPQTVTVNEIDYEVRPDMCVRAKASFIKDDVCACNGDECERCNDRYSTVAQNDCDVRQYGDNSSISERSNVASPVVSSQDEGSEKGAGTEPSVTEYRDAASGSTHRDQVPGRKASTFDRHASPHVVAAGGPAALEREPRTPSRRRAGGLSLERLLEISKMSSHASGDGKAGTDDDLLNVLTTITDSPTSSVGHGLTVPDCAARSLENIMDGVDESAASSYHDKYEPNDDEEDSDDADVDEEGKSKKALLRSDADVRVVQKLFNLTTVTPENAVFVAKMPVQELNKQMQQAGLSDAESSLVRDIRRRGKNKVAARNCRKRKIENIDKLEQEVAQLHRKHESLLQERERASVDAAKYKRCVVRMRKFMYQSGRLPRSSAGSMSNLSASQADLNNSGFGSLSQESVAGNMPFSARSADSGVFATLDDSTTSVGLAALRAQNASSSSVTGDILPVPSEAHVNAGMEAISAHYPGNLMEQLVTNGATFGGSTAFLPATVHATEHRPHALAIGQAVGTTLSLVSATRTSPVAPMIQLSAPSSIPAAGLHMHNGLGLPLPLQASNLPLPLQSSNLPLPLQSSNLPLPLQSSHLYAAPGAHAGMVPLPPGAAWMQAVWPTASYPPAPAKFN